MDEPENSLEPLPYHVELRNYLKSEERELWNWFASARVRGLLIAYGYGYPVATTLGVLMTEAARQPVEIDGNVFHVPVGERHCVQGAPTSPGICNALLLRLDHRLAGLARKRGLVYTRYADDLSFSGDVDRNTANKFRSLANRIVEAEGFAVNAAKTRLMGQGSRQTVTGVVVNQTLGLSRQERRRLRAMAHKLQRESAGEPFPDLSATFRGKLSYLSMLNPRQAAQLTE